MDDPRSSGRGEETLPRSSGPPTLRATVHGHLRVCEDRIPAGLLRLEPTPYPLPIGPPLPFASHDRQSGVTVGQAQTPVNSSAVAPGTTLTIGAHAEHVLRRAGATRGGAPTLTVMLFEGTELVG